MYTSALTLYLPGEIRSVVNLPSIGLFPGISRDLVEPQRQWVSVLGCTDANDHTCGIGVGYVLAIQADNLTDDRSAPVGRTKSVTTVLPDLDLDLSAVEVGPAADIFESVFL